MQNLKDMPSEGKLPLLRHCQEVQTVIFPLFGIAPAENPQILGLCIIHDPKGIYYGGTVAAPVIRGIFENILPYLGIEKVIFLIFLQKAIREIPQAGLINKQKSLILKEI